MYKFVYKPFLIHLDKRSKKIADSLDKARKIDEDFKNAEVKHEAMIVEARKEATAIIEEAEERSEKVHQEKITQTTAEAKDVIDRAKEQINEEKDKAVKAAKAEIGDLVVTATEKVLQEKVSTESDQKLVENILKKVKVWRLPLEYTR